jgi:hypothetical protein
MYDRRDTYAGWGNLLAIFEKQGYIKRLSETFNLMVLV